MPPRRLDLPGQRLVTSSIAAKMVGTTKAQFLEEVKCGLWSPAHPCSTFRKEPYWDINVLQRDVDRAGGLSDNLALEKEELLRGLGGETGVA